MQSHEGPQLAMHVGLMKGRACLLCPPCSDVDLFSDSQRIVDLDAEVSDGAFDLRMPQKQLDGAQVAGLLIDQRGFGATDRMRSK